METGDQFSQQAVYSLTSEICLCFASSFFLFCFVLMIIVLGGLRNTFKQSNLQSQNLSHMCSFVVSYSALLISNAEK